MARRGGKRPPGPRQCTRCLGYSLALQSCPHCGHAMPRERKRSKFNNEPVEVDGIVFQSGKEAREYGRLKMLQRAGKISKLKLQQRFDLIVAGVMVCFYKADFTYYEDGLFKVVDAKGFRTATYKLKKRLMRACHGIEIIEV